jgi:nitrite reductase/ring-hydroxylating ferredoxin subunit
MGVRFLKRGILQRILGIPATPKPADSGSWRFSGGTLTVDLDRTPELRAPGGAARFEGGTLPLRVLVIRDEEGAYRAFHNRCSHLGHRRLDPVPGQGTVQCCSVSKSTYDLEGNTIHGPAPEPIATFPVSVEGNLLKVRIG